MDDLISRQQAIDDIWTVSPLARLDRKWVDRWLRQLPSAQPTFDARDTQYNLPIGTDLISRAAAQTELQLSARRYTVAHEAHGEGQVVWSESLISVSDAMDVLRKIPSAQPTFDARDTQYNLPIGTDLISRAQAIEAVQNRHMMLSKEKVLLINDIKKLPSAQPKRGWWIEIINSRGVVVALRCSRCEKSPRHGVRSDFCPNCGADMREVTE